MPRTPAAYDAYREKQAKISADRSREGRDIAPLPAVVDADRKAECERSFERFCRLYFPQTFCMPWSDDHRKAIGKIEAAVLHGGLFALAMPRGSGKTSLCETACVWALLYGHRRFVVLIGSDETAAIQLIDSIKGELENNDALAEDFPEVCHPIRMLEGIAHRCNGQLYQDENTHMTWTASTVVLPTIPDSRASGGVVEVTGITGRIRGMKHKRADGGNARPDLVVVDDPQTDASAKSPTQNAERERILCGAVLGLAGPGEAIAGVMPCTVIAPGDMADRTLDRQKHPEWQGERTKLMYGFPADEALWEEYRQIRADSLRAGNRGVEATEFYRRHRKAMDRGAVPAWPERFRKDELSAVQHAMNLRFDLGDPAFMAEYQNEPIPADLADEPTLTADEIAVKVNAVPRGEVPAGREHLTAFIDVQGKLLYYVVAAWSDDLAGDVVEYGTYPDQKRGHFTARDAKVTLKVKAPKAGDNGAILAGLNALVDDLAGRVFARADGTEMRVGKLLVDAGWKPDLVYQFCRQTAHAAVVMPSRGRGIGAAAKPYEAYVRRQGERIGHHWMMPSVKGKRTIRHVEVDVNYWKSLVHQQFAVQPGDPGGLALYGKPGTDHTLFAEHLAAEYRVRTSGQGRTVDEWRPRPGKPDNHWLDGIVGAAAAASMLGCNPLRAGATVPASAAGKAAKRKPREREAVYF